jgi:hypothetical protein
MITPTHTGWRKSSFSDNDGNCVEIARAGNGSIGVRDSKDPNGPILAFEPSSWLAFTRDVCTGRFDR